MFEGCTRVYTGPRNPARRSLVNRATPENTARATHDIDALARAGLDRGVAAGVACRCSSRSRARSRR